jgi:hypothetical protein
LAASKNTNSMWVANAAASTCGAVSIPAAYATGTLPSTTALARSVATIRRRRSSRSATAPASNPTNRYGAASETVTSPVHRLDPVIW